MPKQCNLSSASKRRQHHLKHYSVRNHSAERVGKRLWVPRDGGCPTLDSHGTDYAMQREVAQNAAGKEKH